MKIGLLCFILSIALISCGQSKGIEKLDFSINEKLKEEVEVKISASRFGNDFDKIFIYDNTILVSTSLTMSNQSLSTQNIGLCLPVNNLKIDF
jgi:hypothetical protein